MRPILRGRDIKKYSYEYNDLWIINTHNGIKDKGVSAIDIDNYPAIKEHLNKYYAQLEKRTDKGISPFHLRNCAYMSDFFKHKLVYTEIMTDNPDEGYDFPCFSFDENSSIALNTAYIMTGDLNELKYIMCLLNSKLGKQLVKFYVVQLQQRQYRMLNQYVVDFPIPKLTLEDYMNFGNLATKILENKKINQDFKELEKTIKDKVYNIFNMSKEEIDFIELQ
ncbi:TaqI-like C-terminal specificity domain-containing protein [Myroides marinus]|uniref:TaqI-like C-terminal specificity domain-containing protein n=1 Tax=Myroides marinus TaxID=703342 RepID=UPI003D9C5C94